MRASTLPIVSKCRGSYKLTKGHGSVISRLGTAFHEAARAQVLHQPMDMAGLTVKYGLTEDEIRGLKAGLYNLVINIPEDAMVMADDVHLTGLGGKLTGTPDLAVYHKKTALIVDWKSGWQDTEPPETNNQMISYAIMLLEELERLEQEVDSFNLMIVQPKLGQIKSFTMTPAQIKELAKDIEQIIDQAEAEGEPEFTTGPWCAACFKSMNCPAFAGQVQALAKFLVPGSELEVKTAVAAMLPFAKACRFMADKIEDLAKAYVDKHGELDLGDGQKYVKAINQRKEVEVKKALQILKEYFSEEDIFNRCLSMSLTKIMDLAKETKRGLTTILSNRLTQEGAITQKPIIKYSIIKGGQNGGPEEGTN
jgi:CRISPR/Cas system-associated exonuclease Cas4 (RecB family)